MLQRPYTCPHCDPQFDLLSGFCWQTLEGFGNLCEGACIKVCFFEEVPPKSATVLHFWVKDDGTERMLVDIDGEHITVNKKDCRQLIRLRNEPADTKANAWLIEINRESSPMVIEVGIEIEGSVHQESLYLHDFSFEPNLPWYGKGTAGWYWQFRKKGCGNLKKDDTVMVPSEDLPAQIPDEKVMIPAKMEKFEWKKDEKGNVTELIHVKMNGESCYFTKNDCCQIVNIYSRKDNVKVHGWVASFDPNSEKVLVRYRIKGNELRKRIPIVDLLRKTM